MTTSTPSPRLANQRGFSLVETLVTMAITLLIMGGTMAALGDAWKSNDSATLVTEMNNSLRVGMDLMVRDLLQVGQGLKTGRVITIPSGAGATAIRLPGPPGTNYTLPANMTAITAVIPGPGRGPVINGRATDMITTVAVDSIFEDVCLTALTQSSMTVAQRNGSTTDCGVDMQSGTIVEPGELIMLHKGSYTAMIQVTAVAGQSIHFSEGDSMNLNQQNAGEGSIRDYIQADGGEPAANNKIKSSASRIRMISYYIDAVTDPNRPRLVRRMNNGNATTFDNTLGTAVAFDIEDLRITYDLVDLVSNPTSVAMTDADMDGSAGAAAGCPCEAERIRKVNVTLQARGRRQVKGTRELFRNTLATQISLRSLAFVDRYDRVGNE